MRRSLITATAIGGAVGLFALPLLAQQAGRAKGPWTTQKIAKTFNQTCAKCHAPPDAKFTTDLAWLDQVNRTS